MTSTSAGAKVQGINMMQEEFLESYNGYHLGYPMDPMEPPSPVESSPVQSSGRRPQRRRRHLRTTTAWKRLQARSGRANGAGGDAVAGGSPQRDRRSLRRRKMTSAKA